MNDIDDEIRNGLIAATDDIGGIDASDLARQLTARRENSAQHGTGRARRTRATHHRRLGVAAVVAVVALIGGAAWLNSDNSHEVEVKDDQPATIDDPSGWDAWEPGWHSLDTGPVPAMNGASIADYDGHLIVAGSVYADNRQTSAAYSFDATTREWEQLPVPPLATITVVAAGDTLVAVGEPAVDIDEMTPIASRDFTWATWQTGDDTWNVEGTFQVAEPLRSVGALGPSPTGGGAYLLWTGASVVDVTHGAALGLAGEVTALEFPADIVAHTHLLSAQPVWTGEQVVLTSWSSEPGIAWNADGSLFEDTSVLPAELTDPDGVVRDTGAVALDGEVVLVTLDDDITRHNVVALDPRSRAWRILPDLPTAGSSCRQQPVVVAGEVVVNDCAVEATAIGDARLRPLRLHNGAWESIGVSPSTEPCCMRTFLGTDDALIVWSTDTDTQNNPGAPFVRGTVWIPPRAGASADVSATTSTLPITGTTVAPTIPLPTTTSVPVEATCTLSYLPDLTDVLPERVWGGPERGIGGDPMSGKGCARYWGTPEDPGVHVTQWPGDLPYTLTDPQSGTGPITWGTIEDGFGLVHNGDIRWSVIAFGLSKAEFVSMVDALNAAATTG